MKHKDHPNDSACAAFRVRLSAQRDGEHHGDDAELSRHVATCRECTDFERELDTLAPLFDSLRRTTPPPALFDRIAQRLPREATPAIPVPTATPAGAWFLRAAAGVIGFLSVFGLARWPGGGSPPPASSSLELFARVERALDHPVDLGSFPEREFLLHYSAGTETQR